MIMRSWFENPHWPTILFLARTALEKHVAMLEQAFPVVPFRRFLHPIGSLCQPLDIVYIRYIRYLIYDT